MQKYMAHVYSSGVLFSSACQNFSMRLFVLGHYHKGKTTLLHRLRGLRSDSAKRGAPGVLESEGSVVACF